MSNKSQNPQEGKLYAVYGTLREGFSNHHYLRNDSCILLGMEKSEPIFTMVSLGPFPGVLLEGNNRIVYEVYCINDPVVEKALDKLEGYPGFYDKTQIKTQWGLANMYFLNKGEFGNRPVIESGDWAKYIIEQFEKKRSSI